MTRRENAQKQMHLDSLKFTGYLKLNVPKTVAMMRSALSYTMDKTSGHNMIRFTGDHNCWGIKSVHFIEAHLSPHSWKLDS